MNIGRTAGILLHPTSLPGPYGIGELGSEAYRFADWLHAAAQGIWQVLPLVPTGWSHSPYQSFSSFAGNPLLISIERLVNDGLLDRADVENSPPFDADRVDFEAVAPWKHALLRKAHARFRAQASDQQRSRYDRFYNANAAWIDDYAVFMALREAHDNRCWTDWPAKYASHNEEALAEWTRDHPDEVDLRRFNQFVFAEQWSDLRRYCNDHGIRIMGDIPIYTAHDSADVWAHPEFFHLDERGLPTLEAGVPPDYFSATGQLWGNPIYRWDRLAETGYEWWVNRMRFTCTHVDLVRIDHFRGFESYWEVPATEHTALNGRWVEGPGIPLFDAIRRALGDLPIVAENLGIITPEVEAMRKNLGLPGMAVLQFAWGTDPHSPGLLPHMFTPDTVAYTGTHDNNTTVGWWNSVDGTVSPEQARAERDFARAYLMDDENEIHWAFIRGAMTSIADMAIVPLQDVYGLGSEARMNTPGTGEGNWRWRFRPDLLADGPRDRLRRLTILYGRAEGKASVEAMW